MYFVRRLLGYGLILMLRGWSVVKVWALVSVPAVSLSVEESWLLMSCSFSICFYCLPCLPTGYRTASVGMVVTDLVSVWVVVLGLVSCCFGDSYLCFFFFWLSLHVCFFFGVFVDAVGDDFSCLGCDMVK